ncbi:MAG: nucleotidyltransferase family protein, partial [Acidimicrobiales bacterium]
MSQATTVGRLLVRCVREHDWTAPAVGVESLAARVPQGAVAVAADYHGVAGCVYRSLPPSSRLRSPALEAAHLRRLDLHVRALGDLAHLAPRLDGLGARWLVIKGPVLAETAYARPDLRGYNDLDVVVDPRRLREVLAVIEDSGGRVLDGNWRLLRTVQAGEMLLRLRHGTLLDLHWHLLNQATVRDSFTIPMPEVMDRGRPVRIGGTSVRTLDPVDTLLHLGLHGCLSGGDRLVWLKDVERAIAAGPVRWDEVVARARQWGVGVAVALTLDRSRRVLGASVPEDVVPLLAGGRAWTALATVMDRFSPVAESVGNRSFSRMASRSTRAGLGASARELTRHIAEATRGMNLSRRPHETDMDPESPGSPRYPGTAAER